MPVPPVDVSELTATLVAVGVRVNCPGRALGVIIGRDELAAVTVGDGSCPTLDVWLASGVLVGTEVAVGEVVGVEVGAVVEVNDGVTVGTLVDVGVGVFVGVEVEVAGGPLVAVEVLVGVGVGFGSGPKTSVPSESTTSSQ